MSVNLSPVGGAAAQFLDNNGNPLTGGKLYTYEAGTTTPQATYTTSAGNVAHANPIILDSAGRVPGGEIWLTASLDYKFSLFTSANVLIATWDNITTGVITNASNVVYDPAGTGAIQRTVQSKLRDTVSVLDFGADPTGATDSKNAIQAALDTGKVVFMPVGTYRTNSPLIISKSCRGILGEIFGDGDGTRIDYYGTDAAIKLYDGTSGTRRVTQARVENIAIRVQNAGVNGIDFTDASYCTFRDLFIRLLNSNQAGIYGKGNGLGSSPYYNIFDGVKIFGNADNVTNPGQRGYYFQGELAGGFGSNGPNANMISNGGQISGVSHGVHIESGTGNVFSNMIMETIAEYAYRFGNALSAAPGRADQNSVVNHWMEGASTCVFARFEGDAASNSLTNYSINSVSPIIFDNQSSSESNYCKPGGNFYVVSFYGKNIPAGATTPLAPTNESWPFGGGVIPPFLGMVPYLMKVSVHNFASGGLGSGVVQAYRSGTPNPNLAFTVNNANRFGGTAIQRTPNTSLAYNTFDGTINSQIEVAVTTDGSWNQTTSDIEVQVIFFG